MELETRGSNIQILTSMKPSSVIVDKSYSFACNTSEVLLVCTWTQEEKISTTLCVDCGHKDLKKFMSDRKDSNIYKNTH
jgi:Zn ribbon nucleic-acid-binding protein